MPYNSETGQYERRVTTILDETPDGDTVNSAVAVKIDAAVDDGPTDLNHHKVQGGHYPATSTATGSRYLHQSPAGIVSWRDGVPADQAAQVDASNVTDGAAWRTAIGAEAAGAAVTEVATHNADASAHGLDSKVWTVTQGGTGASTTEDARAALDVYSKGAVDAALGGIRTGTAHASQSIIKAALGPRPDGWTAADCDAPVASLSYSGNVVTVEAGLQVAYADNGRVQLSEELAAPQTVDLSAAADGTYHIAVNMNADGSFSAPSHSSDYPQIGTRKLLAYPVPVAASTSASGREIPFSVDGDLATYWSPSVGSGTAIIGEWIECTLPDTKGGTKSVVAKAASAYAGSAPATADIEQQIDGVWTKVGAVKYLSNVLYGSFQATAGNATLRIKATAGTVSSSYGWAIADIQVSDLTAGDLYDPATVTMYDKDDNPIRRVYLGWVEKFGGVITDVHCYSLGDTTIVPVNNGANVSINSRYIQGFPYVAGGAPTLTSQIYFQGKWGETGFIFSTAGLGTKATTIGEDLFFQTGSNSLTSLGTNAGSDFTVTTNTPTKGRIKVRRGY
jgi:hypothetical protein